MTFDRRGPHREQSYIRSPLTPVQNEDLGVSTVPGADMTHVVQDLIAPQKYYDYSFF